MPLMRELARHFVFPLFVGGAIAIAIAAFHRGVAPERAIFPILIANVLCVVILERALPYRREWSRSHGDSLADWLYLPTLIGVGPLVDALVRSALVLLGGWVALHVGADLWPTQWPWLAQLALAAVVAEFFDYWAHRAMHVLPWLWRLHATHHSAPRLYWLNALRAHPFETLFRGFIGALPLALLGASAEAIALFLLVTSVAGMFQHANIDFALGPWSWVFSVGELHRWHHSQVPEQADRNFGNTYIFWDTVFGTRYLPPDSHCPQRLGIAQLDAFPKDWWGQILSPLRWRAIRERSQRAA